jgi:osmotically-inducible protein OsmY
LSAAVPLVASSRMQKSSDDELKDRIEHRLETDASVKKYDIKVKVTAGEAILTGSVATEAQKAEAERVAKITGITKVQNAIAVDKDADLTLADRAKAGLSKTGEKITDAWITTKVHWFFLGEDALKGSEINVDTANHVVTLKGTVKTEAGRTRAVALARQTDGVIRVVDLLKVV